MPGFDGTGPMGYGPMTGGARGFCVSPIPYYSYGAWIGYAPRFFRGRGRGWYGRGGGRGWRNMFYATGLPGWARTPYGLGYPGIRFGLYYPPVDYYY